MSTQLTTGGPASLVTTDDDVENQSPASNSYLPVMIVSAFLLAAHIPMLFRLGRELWSREHYQFFPFLIPVSAFLMWEGLQRLKEPVKAGSTLICYILILVAAALLVVSSLIGSGTMAALATLLTLATVIYGIGGWPLFRECFPGWVVLFLAVPPPFRLDERLITSLQWWVAYANGKVLDVLGVEHLIRGATVRIPNHDLMVEEACSGIHSLFSSLFCALGLALWARRGVVHTIILLVVTVYLVLIGNIIRVLSCVLSQVRFNYDLASEPQHSVLSISIFICILGLIASTDRFLLFLSPWSAEVMQTGYNKARAWSSSILEAFPDLGRSWLASWTVGLLFAIIASFQFWIVGGDLMKGVSRPNIELAKIGENGLPERILGHQRITYKVDKRKAGHINGEHSQTWYFLFNNQHKCEMSLDYTFTGWHDLTVCYRNAGYNIVAKKVDGAAEGETIKDPFMRVDMQTPHTGEHGFLLFCLFDENGQRIDPPSSRETKLFEERWDYIKSRVLGRNVGRMTIPTYQVQIFIPSFGELTEADKAMAVQFYREIEKHMQVLVQKYKQAAPSGEAEPAATAAAGDNA